MKRDLLEEMRNGVKLTTRDQIKLIFSLSLPAILAQISFVFMEYIDAAMVGQLGANPSASIGLVAPLTWVFFGIMSASVTGFSVQVAQWIGANDGKKARNTFKLGAIVTFTLSFIFCAIGLGIASHVPVWLGGEEAIRGDATSYFGIFMGALPIFLATTFMSGMLRCSGNIRTPSFIHIGICVLDVFFNSLLIFESHDFSLFGLDIHIPCAGLGVSGAATGTVLAELCGGIALLCAIMRKKCALRPVRGEKLTWEPAIVLQATKISIPIAFEHIVLSGALVVTTAIIAPLGAISLAANSLAVSAESICYMPGFGIAEAATTLVGQSIGAKRFDLTKRLSWMCIAFGIATMGVMGALMYAAAPIMFAILTPVGAIQILGIRVLRIEAFAEPLYGAALVCTGSLRGAGDTLVPSLLNLASMWGVRITLSYLLVDSMGLVGIWTAMAIELSCRGCLLLVRVYRKDWSKSLIAESASSKSTPAESASAEAASAESTPAESAPAKSAPVEAAPVEAAPVEV